MQISRDNIIVIICALTGAFLIVGIFVLAYISLYNQRKKKHYLQTTAMQKEFEQELIKTQMEVQEHTLKTIASDIHDNVGQLLSITKLTLTSISGDGNMEKNGKKLENAQDLLDTAITELRQLASLVHADNLLAKGLGNAIEIEVNWLAKSDRLQVNYSVNGSRNSHPALPHQTELIAYRITQELLNNVIKHAEAASVTISISYEDAGIQISIADNGKGFDVNTAKNEGKGLGMHTLFNRARMIHATLNLQSEKGKGTVAQLFIPYAKTNTYDTFSH